MSKEYNEKEVRFLPRCIYIYNSIDTNFGEIEMCIGLPIKYTIKVKSKVTELYSLKKIDFVRLTIVFKEYMESFLEKALILYKEFKINYYRAIKEKKEMSMKIRKSIILLKKKKIRSGKKVTFSTPVHSIRKASSLKNKPSIVISPITSFHPCTPTVRKNQSTKGLLPKLTIPLLDNSPSSTPKIKKHSSTKTLSHFSYADPVHHLPKKCSTKSLMHVPLSSETEENQAAIKKVLSQSSIQFIVDMTNEIKKFTTLLNSKKETMPKNVYNIVSNKIEELRDEKEIGNQLRLLDEIEEMLRDN